MKRKSAQLLIGVMMIIGVNSCLDPYATPAAASLPELLVVEGFLFTQGDSAIVRLSRTARVDTDTPPEKESAASVMLEDEAGNRIALPELHYGVYGAKNLSINATQQYKLVIETKDHHEYNSTYVPARITPPIDSVTRIFDEKNMIIEVSTHDPSNETRYYRWRFNETFNYATPTRSWYKFENGYIQLRDFKENLQVCWKTIPSNDILVGTSQGLANDVISRREIHAIPMTDFRLSRVYSIEVEQTAISREEYEYLLQLKKNTENVGTLFDPQPGRVDGNLTSKTDPDEVVLGYFSAGNTQRKRLFVITSEIPVPRTVRIYDDCQLDLLLFTDTASYAGGGLIGEMVGSPLPIGFSIGPAFCLDCREYGGVNKEPSWWP